MKTVIPLPWFSFVMGLAVGFAALSIQLIRYSSDRSVDQSLRTVSFESAVRTGTSNGVAAANHSANPPPRAVAEYRPTKPPPWAVPYGEEFWHSPVKQDKSAVVQRATAPFDLDQVIERVSHAFTQKAETARVEAKAYSAVLDRAGLRFSPCRATAEPDSTTEMRIHTVAVRSGERTLFPAGSDRVPCSVWGNTVQRLLNGPGGLIEHYAAGSQGVEVAWIFQHRPTDGGQLQIEAQVAGLQYADKTEHGHHFADIDGTARVRIGRATLVEANGKRTDLPLVAKDNRLRLTVPGDVLAAATFPIAIDPLISPEFGMDEPVLSYSLGDSMDPAIASNGSDYLAVWVDSRRPNGYFLFGTRISSDGAVLDPRGLPLNVTDGGVLYPAVASNGRDFLVVWRSGFTGGLIVGTRVTPEGVALDANHFLQIGFSSRHPRPAIASDGTDYLVVWEHPPNLTGDEDILGARVTAQGQVLDTPSLSIRKAPNRQRGPAVAWNGSVYLVVWDESEGGGNAQTMGTRLDRGGVPLESEPFMIGGGEGSTFPTPAVASDGRDFLVALNGAAVRVAADGKLLGMVSLGAEGIPAVACNGEIYFVVLLSETIRGTRISTSGTVLGNTLIKDEGIAWDDWSRPAVASLKGHFFAAWHERPVGAQHVFGAHVKGDGTAAPDIPISTDQNSQFSPAVASNGEDYLVVWRDIRLDTHDDIFGVRVSAAGAVLDPAALAIRRAPLLEWNPAVASDGQDYYVVWQEYPGGNAWQVHGARVLRDGTVLPAMQINTARSDSRAPAVASNGRDYLVAWGAWSGTRDLFNDIYAARVSGAGVLLDSPGLLISSKPSLEGNPAIASNGQDYLVAWEGLYFPTFVSAKRVTSAGIVLDPDGIPLTQSTNEPTAPSIAFNGRDYLVVWKEYEPSIGADIFGTRVAVDGRVLDTPPLGIATSPVNQVYPKVASDGQDFFVMWHAARGPNYSVDLVGRRVSGSGGFLEPDGFLIQSAGYNIYGQLASNGRNYLAAYAASDVDGLYRVRGRFIDFTVPICPPRVEWQATFGSGGYEDLRSLQQTSDGGFILAGYAYSGDTNGNKTSPTIGGTGDYWLVRVDASGRKIWENAFGSFNDEQLFSVKQTQDGGFLLGGWSDGFVNGSKTSPNLGDKDYWIVRTDAQGKKLWDRTFGGTAADTLLALVTTADGGFLLGGISASPPSGNKTSADFGRDDYWIVRLDAQGNKLWDRSFGGDGQDLLLRVASTSDGGFILGGSSHSDANTGNKTSVHFGDLDYWVVRVSANGDKLWEKSFGTSSPEILGDLQQTSDGGFIVGGLAIAGPGGNKTSPAYGMEDFWVVRLDGNGNQLWDRTYGGASTEYLQGVQEMADGGFALAGFSISAPSGTKTSAAYGINDYWVVRIDARGTQRWDESYGGSGEDALFAFQRTANNGFILGGVSSSSAGSGNKTSPHFEGSSGYDFDYWVVRLRAETPEDCDGDGVPDSRDLCPDTPSGAVVNADGCSVAQLCPCDGSWQNHGEYAQCIIERAWEFYRSGRIDKEQRQAIIREAARSDCGERALRAEAVRVHLCPQTLEECRRDGIGLILSGGAATEWIIEKSNDLIHWSRIGTGEATPIGSEVLFPSDAAEAVQFYRARPAP